MVVVCASFVSVCIPNLSEKKNHQVCCEFESVEAMQYCEISSKKLKSRAVMVSKIAVQTLTQKVMVTKDFLFLCTTKQVGGYLCLG